MRTAFVVSVIATALILESCARARDSSSLTCGLNENVSIAEARASLCGFDVARRRFAGTASEQARCLLRQVKLGAQIGAPNAPSRLTDRAGTPLSFSRQRVEAYATQNNIALADLGLTSAKPLTAEYFVIHDTSAPNCSEVTTPTASCPAPAQFPPDRDQPQWPVNSSFGGHKPPTTLKPTAHAWTNRVGGSIVEAPFETHISHVKFDYCHDADSKRGLFLGVENIQPRIGKPASPPPGQRANDLVAPVPGFTEAQYRRLALLYVAASARRGHWLIPAFHAVIDAKYADGHDDPQNFDVVLFDRVLAGLIASLEKADPGPNVMVSRAATPASPNGYERNIGGESVAHWTIIGKGTNEEGAGKSFGVTLDTDTGKWIAVGPSVDLFFATKSGNYRIVAAPERGTRLENASASEAAFFTNLVGSTPVGATGNGRASEKGLLFTWKLDSK